MRTFGPLQLIAQALRKARKLGHLDIRVVKRQLLLQLGFCGIIDIASTL